LWSFEKIPTTFYYCRQIGKSAFEISVTGIKSNGDPKSAGGGHLQAKHQACSESSQPQGVQGGGFVEVLKV
jgi:hypothetical protein